MDIENPITFDSRKEVNTYREPKIIGECAYCGTYIFDLHDHIQDNEEDKYYCDIICFASYMEKVGRITKY